MRKQLTPLLHRLCCLMMSPTRHSHRRPHAQHDASISTISTAVAHGAFLLLDGHVVTQFERLQDELPAHVTLPCR